MVVRAIELVRKIRDQQYNEMKNVPMKEQLEYIKEKSDQLQQKIKVRERSIAPKTG